MALRILGFFVFVFALKMAFVAVTPSTGFAANDVSGVSHEALLGQRSSYGAAA
jgi:hypothetical protein